MFGKADDRVGLDVRSSPPGDVVDHYRLRRRGRNLLEIGVEAVLGRFVVVGNHDEERIGAIALEGLHAGDRPGEGVGPAAHDDRPSGAVGLSYLQDLHPFLEGKAGRLPGRPEGYEEMDPGLDLPVNARGESVVIDPLPLEGGQKGGAAAFQCDFFHMAEDIMRERSSMPGSILPSSMKEKLSLMVFRWEPSVKKNEPAT